MNLYRYKYTLHLPECAYLTVCVIAFSNMDALSMIMQYKPTLLKAEAHIGVIRSKRIPGVYLHMSRKPVFQVRAENAVNDNCLLKYVVSKDLHKVAHIKHAYNAGML